MKALLLAWIVIQATGLILTSTVDYGGITVDQISGELVKPDNMSEERFRVLKLLRLKDMLRADKELVADGVRGRVRREAAEDVPPLQGLGSIEQGFYKQESLILEKFTGLETVPVTESAADLVRVQEYRDGDLTADLGFFVTQGPDNAGERVALREWSGSDWSQEVDPSPGSSSLDSLLNLHTLPEARISDLVIIKHPKGGMTFLCVTIDYAVDYPRSEGNAMDVNVPVNMPLAGKSSLFRFEYQASTKTYSLSREAYLDTIRAQDAEVWYFDEKIFLGIAQLGDTTTQSPFAQSLIYVQAHPDIPEFTLLQGSREDGNLITNGALRIRHFEMNSRSCVAFANSGSDRAGNLTDINTSPIFAYNYETEKYELWQELDTFGAWDIDFLAIPDPYPLHSQFFLIVANKKERGTDVNAEAMVFKYVSGRFRPFQALPATNVVSVLAYSSKPVNLASADGYPNSHLDQLVMLLTGHDTEVFQYDGVKFALQATFKEDHDVTSLELVNLSGAVDEKNNNARPVVVKDIRGGSTMQDLVFASSDALSYSDEFSSKLGFCLKQKDDQVRERNYKNLQHVFEAAPKKSKQAEGFHLKDLTFEIGSSLTASDVEVNPDFKTKAELAVESMDTLDMDYVRKVEKVNEVNDNITKAIEDMKERVEKDPSAVLVNQTNVLQGNLILDEVEGLKLAGDRIIFPESSSVNLASDNDMEVDFEDFLDNIVIVGGDTAVNDPYGRFFLDNVSFENISLAGRYEVKKLGDFKVGDLAKTGEGLVVAGNFILKDGATFQGDVELDGLINDEIKMDREKLLLRSGDQDFKEPAVFKFVTNFENLVVDKYNDIDMSIMERSLNKETDFTLLEDLTIKNLEIEGDVMARMGALNPDLSYDSLIDFEELFATAMRKSTLNNVQIKHVYKQLEAADISTGDINQLSWPDDFVKIKDDGNSLDHSGTLVFDELITQDGGRIVVKDRISDGVTDIDVDENGNLDVLLTTANTPAFYERRVSGNKTFEEIELRADSTVTGKVFGLDMPTLVGFVSSGEIDIPDDVEIDSAMLTGNTLIDHLTLHNITMDTDCLTVDGCIRNNLAEIYFDGVQRDIEVFPEGIHNLFVDQANFAENVNVESLNGHDPGSEYIPLQGSLSRTVTKDLIFKDKVVFGANIDQVKGGHIMSCVKNLNDQYLCAKGEDEECCQPDFYGNCRCFSSGTDCLIKENVKDVSVCAEIVENDVRHIHANSLKLNGTTEIYSNITFHGGFRTKVLETVDCNLNGIDCANIVSTVHSDTLTGTNHIFGTLVTDGEARVRLGMEVDKNVDGVDVSHMYVDSLPITGDEEVVVFGSTEFKQDFTVQNFTSNDVLLKETPPSYLTDMSAHVLNRPGVVQVCSDLEFRKGVSTESVDAEYFKGVELDRFFNKLWTNDPQVIHTDITVNGNITFHNSLVSSTKNAPINNVDLEFLDKQAVRIDGNQTIALKNVEVDTLISMNDPEGLHVEGTFLNVHLPDDVVLRLNSDNVVINAKKNFLNRAEVFGNADFLGNLTDSLSNLDRTATVDMNKLIEFMDNKNWDNVKVHGNLIVDKEPNISSVNGQDLQAIKDSKWYGSSDAIIDYSLSFDEVSLEDQVLMAEENAVINDIDLLDYRDNYLSLSLAQDQNITADYTFLAGLVTGVPVNVPSLTAFSDDVELSITVEGTVFRMTHLRDSILMKNMSHADIDTVLNFTDSVAVKGSLYNALCNGVDLDQEALTYKDGDEKTFLGPVDFLGNLVTDKVDVDRFRFPSNVEGTARSSGLKLEDNVLDITLTDVLANGIDKEGVDAVEIKGLKTFSNLTEFSSLTGDQLIDDLHIGTCASPRILLTKPCTGTVSQVITGSVQFGSATDPVDLEVSTLVLEDGLFNNVSLEDMASRAVYKVWPLDVVVTAEKTFQEGLTVGDADFKAKVFDLKVDTLVEETLRSADMSYPSGAHTPNLTNLIGEIKHDVDELPSEFVYTPVFSWKGVGQGRMFSLVSPRVVSPFKLAGLEMTGSGRGMLRFYSLYSNVYTTASEIQPLLTFNVTLNKAIEEIKLVSLPTAGGDYVLVFNDLDLEGAEGRDEAADLELAATSSDDDNDSSVSVVLFKKDGTMRYVQRYTGLPILDLETVQVDGKDCVIFCQGEAGGSVQWFNGATFEEYKDLLSELSLPGCYKVSAVPSANDVKQSDVESVVVVATDPDRGNCTIIKKEADVDDFEILQTTLVPDHSQVELSEITDSLSGRMVFISILAPRTNFVSIATYQPTQDNSTFQFLEQLSVPSPRYTAFSTWEGNLVLSVLHGTNSFNGMLCNYVYRGMLKFVKAPEESIWLRGVTEFTPFVDTAMKGRYVLTVGADQDPSSLPTTAIYRYLYKENRVPEDREQFRNKLPTSPSFITLECHTMVHNYLNKLYLNNTELADGFNFEKMGHIMLRLMPRSYMQYRVANFPADIRKTLEDPRFTSLLARSPPSGMANLYKYEGSLRSFEDKDFVGAISIYQDVDELLYLYSKLMTADSEYRAVSFWTSCDADGQKIEFSQYKGEGLEPLTREDKDFVYQCTMIHDISTRFLDDLKSLDNKAVAGAVVMHQGKDTSSERFACGYIKQPAAARLQLYQDHPQFQNDGDDVV